MNLFNLALKKISKQQKRRWFGACPDHKLEKKLNQSIPENISDDADFFQLDYSLLKTLINKDMISTKYRYAYSSIIYTGTKPQIVEALNEADLELINHSIQGKKLQEVMKLCITTKDKERHYSDIQYGKENFISSIGEIYQWFYRQTNILLNCGKQIAKLEIVHVHPSLEVLIYSSDKTTTVTNGLSDRDIKTGSIIREKLNYPVRLSALLPSGLKYSVVF
jgi:hypothetical protein